MKLMIVIFATTPAIAAADTPPDLSVPEMSETGKTLIPVPLRDEDRHVDTSPIDDRTLVRTDPVGALTLPITFAGSAFAAGFGYAGHPTRTSGFESQLRGDAWQGLEWGLHASYTIDVINADDSSTGTYSATMFHDLNLGGSAHVTDELWSFLEMHMLRGATDYGNGAGFLGGIGRHLGPTVVEVGLGGLLSNGDKSLTASAHVVDSHVTTWLGAGVTAIYTNDSPYDMKITTGGSKLAGGPELTFGPFRRLTVVVDGLFGDRESALISRGQVVENTADVEHLTARVFLWWSLSDAVRGYLGASLRTATAPTAVDYTLASGFAGAVVSL